MSQPAIINRDGRGHEWANEGFSFAPHEYDLVMKLFPDLVATDKEIRRRAWVAFAQTSVGQAFRVR